MKKMSDNHNSLLNRREVCVEVESVNNPGFESITSMIGEQFKAKAECIVVKSIQSKFGRQTFEIEAFIYDSASDKEHIEQKPKVKKKVAQ